MYKPYTIYKRQTKKKNHYIYYSQFRDESGRRLTAVSTGQTSKGAAEVWSIEKLKRGIIPSKTYMTFEQYARDWYVWGKCAYTQRKLDRGIQISRNYLYNRRVSLDKHILPYFKDSKLTSIKTFHIEDWIKQLQKTELATGTINNLIRIIKIMLQEAFRLGYIEKNPTANIFNLRDNYKEKGILTLPEVKELFDKNRIGQIWKSDLKHYGINLLSASTGMRLGEALGLQVQHVYDNYIDIQNVWESRYGLKNYPKNNSKRVIPIPTKTRDNLQELIELSPYKEPESLIFYSPVKPQMPISSMSVRNILYQALQQIGIVEDIRKERNISFHSWRHWFNSSFRTKIPDAKLQRLTGHRSIQMTNRYTHFKLDDFEDVLLLQNQMFS